MPWLYNPTKRRLEYRDARDRIMGWFGGQQSDTSDLLPAQQMQRLSPPEDVRALAEAAIAGDPNAVAPLLSQLQKIAPQYEQLDIQAAQQNGSLAGTSAYAQDPAYLRAQLGLVQSALRNTASKDDLDARRRTLQERARLLGVTLPPLPQNSPTAAPGSPPAGGTSQGGSSEQGAPNQALAGQGGTPPGGFTTAMMQDPEYLAIYQAVGDTAVAAHLYGEKRKLDAWEQLLDSHELNQKQWAPLLEGERAKQKAPEKFAEQRRQIMARWNGQNTEEIQRALQELSWQEQSAMGELDEGIANARAAIFPGMNQTMDRAYAAGKSDVKGTPGVVRYKDLAPHQRAALFGASHAATGGASSADPNYQPDLEEEEKLARLPRFAAGGMFGGAAGMGGVGGVATVPMNTAPVATSGGAPLGASPAPALSGTAAQQTYAPGPAAPSLDENSLIMTEMAVWLGLDPGPGTPELWAELDRRIAAADDAQHGYFDLRRKWADALRNKGRNTQMWQDYSRSLFHMGAGGGTPSSAPTAQQPSLTPAPQPQQPQPPQAPRATTTPAPTTPSRPLGVTAAPSTGTTATPPRTPSAPSTPRIANGTAQLGPAPAAKIPLPKFAAGGQLGGTNFSGGSGYTPGAPVNVPAPPNPATGYGANPYGNTPGGSGMQPPAPSDPNAGADYHRQLQRQLDALNRERERIQSGINSSLAAIAADAQRQMYVIQQERVRVQQQFEQRKQAVLQDFTTRAWALYEERNQMVADNPFIAQRAPGEALRPTSAPQYPATATTGSGLPSLEGFT